MWTSQVYAAGFAQQQASAQDTAPAPAGQLMVAAGTTVPLTLVTQIKAKSTPIGATVRASVAFPVTVGTRLAIPAGVFVEGQLVQAVFPKGYKQPKHQAPVSPLKIHFTRLIYPSGYTVSLNAELSSLLIPMMSDPPEAEEDAKLESPYLRGQGPYVEDAPVEGPPEPQQSQPTETNPYAHAGPNPAVIYGPIVGTAVIAGLLVALSHHHDAALDSVLYDAGYQFQMTVATPLVLDSSRIGKAADVAPGTPDPSSNP